jgi:hypothetical protein
LEALCVEIAFEGVKFESLEMRKCGTWRVNNDFHGLEGLKIAF